MTTHKYMKTTRSGPIKKTPTKKRVLPKSKPAHKSKH